MLGTLIAFVCVAAELASADPAASSAPRIAIISDNADNDLAALVTTELSSDPSISLVERDDLAKIGDEVKLLERRHAWAMNFERELTLTTLIIVSSYEAIKMHMHGSLGSMSGRERCA